MNLWIVIAFDPIPGVDNTTRMLRYGTLAERALKAGHQVTFWTSTFDHFSKKQRAETDEIRRLESGLVIQFLRGETYESNISLARIRHNRTIASRFLKLAPDHQPPDIVFAGIPCLELTESAAVYCAEKKIPLIADIQDIWPEVYLAVLPSALRPIGRLVLNREFARARRIFLAARAITAVSKRYLEWAVHVRGTPASRADEVYYLGYRLPSREMLDAAEQNTNSFESKHRLPNDRPRATFLGQFASSYDVETIAHAARLLKAAKTNVHLILAGKGDKFSRVSKVAEGLDNITLTGWLEYRDSLTLLQRSDFGLAAYSRRATQSLPYKPFEYMAYGLPIISSLDGELKEILQANGLGITYRAGDPRSLADAITQMAGSTESGQSPRRKAYEIFMRDYDGEVIADRMIKYLEGVAGAAR